MVNLNQQDLQKGLTKLSSTTNTFPFLAWGSDDVDDGLLLILGVKTFGLTDLDLFPVDCCAGFSTRVAWI